MSTENLNIKIVSIHQDCVFVDNETKGKLNSNSEQAYKDFLLEREKYMSVCYLDEVFYCDHNNRLHITFKEAFPQEYEKGIVPGFETALTLIHDGKELMVTMFNMNIADKDEIFNVLKKNEFFNVCVNNDV